MEFLKKHTKAVSFFGLLILFWGQYLVFGLARSSDTTSFENFSPLVYPLYSVTLWFFRTLFGTETGYFLLGLFQNFLLAAAISSIVHYLKKAFTLDSFTYIFLLVLSSMMFIVQKWLTRAGMVSSNTLISEGITIPLYLFFFRHGLQALLEQNKKAFLFACLFATCIILTRAQLYWILVVVTVLWLYISKPVSKKSLISAVLICAVIAGFIQGTRVIQNFSEQDEQNKTPSSLYLLSTVVYCTEREDIDLFPAGSAERELFMMTRDWMDMPEHLASIEHESGGLTSRHQHFEAYYDLVKGVLGYYYNYLAEQGIVADMTTMTVTLVRDNLGVFLLHCAQNALVGLIRTVAILRPGINALAGLFYLYLVVCLLISRKNENLKSIRQMTCLGLLCVLLNALVMGPGVFALSRYMFYNLPIMYYTAILFLRALFLEWRKK